MKNITSAILTIMISLNCIGQEKKPTDTVPAGVAKPILQKLAKNQKTNPFSVPLRLETKENNVLLVQIGDKTLASQISDPMIEDLSVENNNTIGVLDKEKAIITFQTDKYSSIEDKDTLLLKLKINKSAYKVLGKLFKKKANEVAGTTNKPTSENVNYIALARGMKLKLPLADLFPKLGPCCADKQNPCDLSDSAEYYNNRIIYYANTNTTVYYDRRGRKNRVGYKDIKVWAGDPISFEIKNVNPDAFKVEITDTAIGYEYQIDTLLSFLPGVNAKFFQSSEKNYTYSDTARAVLLVVYMNLKEFFLQLKIGCIYEFNTNIERKITAKARVDSFINTNLGLNGNIGISQILLSNLDTSKSKNDKQLLEGLLELYSNLPSSYYRMITQIPSVPKDKDKIQFKFNILARENTPYMSIVKEKTVDAYIVKNFRIDVSSGLYYAVNMSANKYNVRADSIVGRNVANTADSTLKSGNAIYKEDLGSGEFGFVSFIHFYKRYSPSFSWGAHIGAGVSLNDRIKPRYFGGLSFLIGRDNTRFIINAGVVGGNVEKISDQYAKEANGTFKWIPKSETTVVTKTKFAVQPFVSISYNLPFRSKKNSTEKVEPPKDEKKTDPKAGTEKKEETTKDESKMQQQSSKQKKEVTRKTFFRN